MNLNYFKYGFCVLLSLLLTHRIKAQYQQSFQSKFINAKFSDTSEYKDLDVAFYVYTSDSIDFPPIFNLPPKCTVFEDGREKVVLISPLNLSVALYGGNVESKNKAIYNLVLGKVDLNAMKTGLILVFTLKDLYYNFTKMTIEFSLSEKRNNKIKVAEKFEFEVNK